MEHSAQLDRREGERGGRDWESNDLEMSIEEGLVAGRALEKLKA